VSVVTNSLRLRSFTPPRSAEEIIHPSMRSRIADISYLSAIGLLALAVGVASLFIFQPSAQMHGGQGAGMQMQQAAKVSFDTGGPIAPGVETTLRFNLTDAKSGQPVNTVEDHEAEMHLIIASRDLSYFAHIHPTTEGEVGRYEVKHTFPTAGEYLLYDEFQLAGTEDEVHSFNLQVGDAPSQAAQLTPDMTYKQANEFVVHLSPVGEIISGKPCSFMVTVARAGKPVTDLEPYLGAASHVVVLDESAGNFAHVHSIAGATPPSGEMSQMGEMAEPPARFGPNVAFTHTFNSPGLYKVWVQFSQAGRVMTVPWVVEAK
jgi:Cu+-exporting ATPase